MELIIESFSLLFMEYIHFTNIIFFISFFDSDEISLDILNPLKLI